MKNSITAFAPASIGNITCGFDLLGMALPQPGDFVTVSKNDLNQVRILKIEGDNGKLPLNPIKNTVSVAIQSLLNHLHSNQGIDIVLKKNMPLGSGLGSSAASAVAGVFAANKLLGSPFNKKELLPFTLDGEEVATGSKHGDNTFPSLLGGIVLISSYNPLQIIELPVPKNLWVTLIYPHIEVLTKNARAVVPKSFSIKKTITQMGHIATFVSALYKNDLELLAHSLKDELAEPYRTSLIAGFDNVKKQALKNGALNCGISGAGPSIYSLSDSKINAEKIGEAMKSVYDELNIESQIFTGQINTDGAKIVD